MNIKTTIVEDTAGNLSEHPGATCLTNPENNYYQLKDEWHKE
jgi:hypothetical protein